MESKQSFTARILRLPDVSIKVGQSRSSIANKRNPKSPWFDPTFPKPLKIGLRSIGWIEAEIDVWIAKQAEKRLATGGIQ